MDRPKTNSEVLKRVDKDPQLIFTIQKRKLEFLGHISHKYQRLQIKMQGKIQDKRAKYLGGEIYVNGSA